MHLRTVNEIALHLQSFRNIELWYQGVYYLKFSMYHQTRNGKKIYAQPYAVTQTNISGSLQTQRTYDSQIVGLSSIVRKQSAFYTKAFHLRYFQQEVQIGDFCRWRIETESFDKQQGKSKDGNNKDHKIDLTIQIGLYFFDSYKKQFNQTISDWRKDAKQVRQIKMIMPFSQRSPQLINTYMPILFTDQYFSLTSCTLHFMSMDYKFRMNEIGIAEFASWSDEQKKKKVKQLMSMKRNEGILQGRNSKRRSMKIISDYLISAMHLQSEIKVYQQILLWLKNIVKLSQQLIKQYGRVYDFALTQDLYLHPKINSIPSPQQLQQSLTSITLLLLQEQRQKQNMKNSKQSLNYEDLIMTLFNKISFIGQNNLKLFQSLINLIKINSLFSKKLYSTQYHQKQNQFFVKFAKVYTIQDNQTNNNKRVQNQIDITLSCKNNQRQKISAKLKNYKNNDH